MAAAGVIAAGVQWYPHRLFEPILVVWPALVFGALFVVGGYDLAGVVRSRTLLLRLVGAVTVASLANYPFLSGSDLYRLIFSGLLAGSTVVLLFLARRSRLALRASDVKPRAAFLLATDACRGRLEQGRDAVAQQFQIVASAALTGVEEEDLAALHEVMELEPEIIGCEMRGELGEELAEELIAAQLSGVRVVDFVELYAAVTGRVPLDLVDKVWILRGGPSPARGVPLARMRSLMSLTVGVLLLVFTAPLFALISLLILLDSGRPVLFRQERLGLYKRPFDLLKFRSMVISAEEGGPRWAARDDPRVTRVGRLLRRTRLDELPQLVNLLRGELRLIGPRPIRKVFANRLAQLIPHYELRFLSPPGITGWPQVLGPYGADFDEQSVKLEMDLYYLRNAGLADDLFILLKTLQVILRGGGI